MQAFAAHTHTHARTHAHTHTHGRISDLFSRSGMVRFLLMKHILRPITFLSRGPEELLCLGEPESSLPLQLGDCGRTPSQGRSATRDGFLNSGDTSRMYFTVGRGDRGTHSEIQLARGTFLCGSRWRWWLTPV